MDRVEHIRKINAKELSHGVPFSASWHMQYKGRPWVFVGGLSARLTEGDVLAVMSQWGEIEDIHLVRDDATGVSKGFAFIKYEDWRSGVLAVDNFTGATLLGRTLSVDHKWEYRPPREKKDEDGNQAPIPEAQPGLTYTADKLRGAATLAHGVNVHTGRSGGGQHPDQATAPAQPGQARAWQAGAVAEQERLQALRDAVASGPVYGAAAAEAEALGLLPHSADDDATKDRKHKRKHKHKHKHRSHRDEGSRHRSHRDEGSRHRSHREEGSRHRSHREEGSRHRSHRDEGSRQRSQHTSERRRHRSRSPPPTGAASSRPRHAAAAVPRGKAGAVPEMREPSWKGRFG